MTWFWNLSTSVLKNKNGAVLKKRQLDLPFRGIVQHLGVFNLLGAVRSHGRKRQNTRAALLPPDLGDMPAGQEMRLGLRLHGSPPTEFQVVNFGTKKNHPIRVSPKNSSSSHMSLRRPRADAILLPLTAQTWRFDLNIWCFPTEIDPCLGAVRHKWAQHPFHGECLWLLLELFFWWLKPVPSVKLLGRITTPASLIASGTSNGAGGPASSSSRTSGVSAVLGGWA